MPMMASDISFDDDDEAPAAPAAGAPQVAADLDNLFSDDAEVQAQRQIQAAQQEARARESGGFAGRVASAKPGAKKLGAVQKTGKANVDQVLEGLWERP
jgi:hypothetical protein